MGRWCENVRQAWLPVDRNFATIEKRGKVDSQPLPRVRPDNLDVFEQFAYTHFKTCRRGAAGARRITPVYPGESFYLCRPKKRERGKVLIPCPSPLISGFQSPHESFKGARVAVMFGEVFQRGDVCGGSKLLQVPACLRGGAVSHLALDALLLRLGWFAAAHVNAPFGGEMGRGLARRARALLFRR